MSLISFQMLEWKYCFGRICGVWRNPVFNTINMFISGQISQVLFAEGNTVMYRLLVEMGMNLSMRTHWMRFYNCIMPSTNWIFQLQEGMVFRSNLKSCEEYAVNSMKRLIDLKAILYKGKWICRLKLFLWKLCVLSGGCCWARSLFRIHWLLQWSLLPICSFLCVIRNQIHSIII